MNDEKTTGQRTPALLSFLLDILEALEIAVVIPSNRRTKDSDKYPPEWHYLVCLLRVRDCSGVLMVKM